MTIALGCMGMSGAYGKTDDQHSIAVIQAAIERGITLLDTGDFYGSGHNELLIGKAIAGRRDRVQLSVKFGAMLGPGRSWEGFDARPAALKNYLAYSLVRLGTDYVDIYRPARLDPAVPIEETVGALADLVKAGYVRAIGLSEVGPSTIRRARQIHPIADLHIEARAGFLGGTRCFADLVQGGSLTAVRAVGGNAASTAAARTSAAVGASLPGTTTTTGVTAAATRARSAAATGSAAAIGVTAAGALSCATSAT